MNRTLLLSALLLVAACSAKAGNDCIDTKTTNCPTPSYSLIVPTNLTICLGDTAPALAITNTSSPGSIVTANICYGTTTTPWVNYDLSIAPVAAIYDDGQGGPPIYTTGATDTSKAGNWTVTYAITGPSPGPGCASFSDTQYLSFSVECCACQSGSCTSGENAGAMQASLDSLRLRLSLGQPLYGKSIGAPYSAGALYVYAPVPSAQLSTPGALTLALDTNKTEVIRTTNGILRQLRTPNILADILTNNPLSYLVRFYAPSSVGAKVSGVYTLSGAPLVVCGVLNPDSTGATSNQLWFYRTEVGTATTNVAKYTWTDSSQQWELITGGDLAGSGGPRHELLQTTSGGGYSRVETRSVHDDSGVLISKRVTYWQNVAGVDKVVLEVNDPDHASLTTANTYDPAGRPQSRINPDGSWFYCQYNSAGRLTARYSSFGNQGLTTDPSLCRVQEFYYDPISATGDDGSVDGTNAPRLVIEKLLGQEIGRRYAVVLNGETRDIRCQTPGAAWNATDNLVTITKTNTSGFFGGELSSVERPDGTLSLYAYATNSAGSLRTNTVWEGQPNSGKTAILDGTRTVTVLDTAGAVLSRTVTDILSGLVTDQASYSGFDAFHRPARVDYLDGTFETTTYSCCGIDTQTDRNGVSTSYSYDALQRPYITTRDGLSTIQTYDAAGRITSTVRQGTDASRMTLSLAQYNVAGQRTASWEPRTGVTTYSETAGTGRTVTTTYTNGTTAVETYAADGSLLSRTGTALHGVRYAYGVEAEGGVQRAYTQEIKLGASGSDTSEWTKTYTDMLGRGYKTLYPDDAYSQSSYNAFGQLWKQRDPDGVTTLTTYNAKNERQYTIQAVSSSTAAIADYPTLISSLSGIRGGTDRITWTTNYVTTSCGLTVRQADTYLWPTNSSDSAVLSGSSQTALNGLRSWHTSYGQTRESRTAILGSGYVLTTNLAPDLSSSVSLSLNGRTLGTTNFDANGAQLGATTFGYDVHQRLTTSTDARNGATVTAYNSADQATSVTTPSPDGAGSGLATATDYDEMGRVWRVTQPDSTVVTNEYLDTGELKKTCGSRTYPVAYTYDYAGRMATLTTWTNFASALGAAITTWNYDSQRGWLNNKRYNDGQGPDYTYTPAGRLQTRQWAREVSPGTRLTATYAYNNAGELATLTYNDGATPGVTNTFDRLGRLATVLRDTTTTTLAYNDAGRQVSESCSGGPLNGLTLTNTYDALLRRTTLVLQQSSYPLVQQSFCWDAASRLRSVTDGPNSASYQYLANSPLVEHILYTNSGVLRMARTNSYDFVNRLLAVTNSPAGGSPIAFRYAYNAASQRTGMTNASGEYWDYKYDYLGQVTNGWKYDSGHNPQERFAYFFDDIGNRRVTVTNSGQVSYTANLLNQYTNVNGQTWTNDPDGNLISGGGWTNTWDAENRLLTMTTNGQKLAFTYDWQGRRVRKQVWNNTAGTGSPALDQRFAYDGWNLIAILDSSLAVSNVFAWGLDLSGSLQGAGGVGGLVIEDMPGCAATNFPAFDGNGNLMALVNVADSTLSAQYEYGPFGELLRATGTVAKANPFRFSTKYQDDETGLLYYGYRYYNTSTGKWISRDPLNEVGSIIWFLHHVPTHPHTVSDENIEETTADDRSPNLYIFLDNGALTGVDRLGLYTFKCKCTFPFIPTGPRPPRVPLGPNTGYPLGATAAGSSVTGTCTGPPIIILGYTVCPCFMIRTCTRTVTYTVVYGPISEEAGVIINGYKWHTTVTTTGSCGPW